MIITFDIYINNYLNLPWKSLARFILRFSPKNICKKQEYKEGLVLVLKPYLLYVT